MAEKEEKPRPYIDCEKCTKAFICVNICPSEVFDKISDDKCPKVARPEDCINCKACENNCPSDAIRVK